MHQVPVYVRPFGCTDVHRPLIAFGSGAIAWARTRPVRPARIRKAKCRKLLRRYLVKRSMRAVYAGRVVAAARMPAGIK